VFGLAEPIASGFKPPPAVGSGLTPRQLEVLHLLDDGLSTAQIAALTRGWKRWQRRDDAA
jgi:DNA-binding NarL/FixJ family response regulator